MAPAEKVQQTGVYIEAKSPKWGGGGIFDDFGGPIAQKSQILAILANFGVFPTLPGGVGYIAKQTGLCCCSVALALEIQLLLTVCHNFVLVFQPLPKFILLLSLP